MKRILSGAAKLAKRIYQKAVSEPLVVRGAVAAIVNVFVLSGVAQAQFAEKADTITQAVLIAVVNLGLLLSARGKVSPGE